MPKELRRYGWAPPTSRQAGTRLEALFAVMFGFAPPPAPQVAPTPCPVCQAREAIPLYATARTEYFRCVECRHVWTLSHDHTPAQAAAA